MVNLNDDELRRKEYLGTRNMKKKKTRGKKAHTHRVTSREKKENVGAISQLLAAKTLLALPRLEPLR